MARPNREACLCAGAKRALAVRAQPPTMANAVWIWNVRLTLILLKNPLFWCQHLGFVAMSARQIPGSHLMWRIWVPGAE